MSSSSSSSTASSITLTFDRLPNRRFSETYSPLNLQEDQNERTMNAMLAIRNRSSTSSLPDHPPALERRNSRSGNSEVSPRGVRETCMRELRQRFSPRKTKDSYINEIMTLLKECPHRSYSCSELTKLIHQYCFDPQNRKKSAEELTEIFQKTDLLISPLIKRYRWLSDQISNQNKPEEHQPLIDRLSSLIFFSSDTYNGLSGFFTNWKGPADPDIKKILNICVYDDQREREGIYGILCQWNEPLAIENTRAIQQKITTKLKQLFTLQTHFISWTNDPADPAPLMQIQWEQIVRSLMQSTPLIDRLSLNQRLINFTTVDANSTLLRQKNFIQQLFFELAQELQHITSTTLSAEIEAELPQKEQLDTFCNSTELLENRMQLGNLAYIIPMLLSFSCWSKADWKLRKEIVKDLFPQDYSKIIGNVGYNLISDENSFLDADIELKSMSEYLVRQRRKFKIVDCKAMPGTEERAPITSPRNLPAVAHVIFQFTIYPSTPHQWEGTVNVHDITVHHYEHITPLIQIFEKGFNPPKISSCNDPS